jgi:hypothetical protein
VDKNKHRRFACNITMTLQQKSQMFLLPFQVYGLIALMAEIFYRAAYGHKYSSAFVMFTMWSCVVAGFVVMIGATIQAHIGFRKGAMLNALLGVFFIFVSGHYAPFIAR